VAKRHRTQVVKELGLTASGDCRSQDQGQASCLLRTRQKAWEIQDGDGLPFG